MPSGGSGGGGSSGAVDYPAYMKDYHSQYLFEEGWHARAALANNPFFTAAAHNPEVQLVDIHSAVNRLLGFCDAFIGYQNWETFMQAAIAEIDTNVLNDDAIDGEIAAYDAILDADTLNVTLPRFYRGMQDLNAVNSSSFIVGAALIASEVSRNKAKFAADLRLQFQKERLELITSGIDAMVKLVIGKLDIERVMAQVTVEASRLEIIARKEYVDQGLHLDEIEARWPFEVFNYMGNMLASIGSASVRTGTETNSMFSGLGGTMMAIGGIMQAVQPKCCFIFIEAAGGILDPIVRLYRDSHMTIRNRRGYCKLADWLVPKMQKSRLWHKAVEWFMTKPMTKAGRWYYGKCGGFPVFSILTGIFWLIMYDLMGVGGPYQRKGGEWI